MKLLRGNQGERTKPEKKKEQTGLHLKLCPEMFFNFTLILFWHIKRFLSVPKMTEKMITKSSLGFDNVSFSTDPAKLVQSQEQ